MEDANILEKVETENKNKYEESIKSFADKLEEQINFLKDKKDQVEESAKESYNERVNFLKEKMDGLIDQYKKVEASSEEAWKNMRDETASTVDSIREEANTAYTGVKDGFGYLFDKFKS